MNEPLISLCMIVRNEADVIEACLQKAMPLTDEWIIVDTGSTDDTIKKCENMGARVISSDWGYDFSISRNIGIQAARGKWILWLDADEEIDETAAPLIHETARKSQSDVILLKVINYYSNNRDNCVPEHSYQFYQPRLFRNGVGINFQGAIHESLHGLQPDWFDSVDVLDISIHHFGYVEDRVKSKKKQQRNMELLQKQLLVPDHDPWCEYHIASEYCLSGEDFLALELLNKSIQRFLEKGRKPPSLIYKRKYDIISRHNLKTMWSGIDLAIQLYPDYVDLHYYKGLYLMSDKRYPEAIAAFEQCILLGEENWKYLILKGAGSFLAQNSIEQCRKELENNC